MAAGVIFMNAHALDLNEIRGFGKKEAASERDFPDRRYWR